MIGINGFTNRLSTLVAVRRMCLGEIFQLNEPPWGNGQPTWELGQHQRKELKIKRSEARCWRHWFSMFVCLFWRITSGKRLHNELENHHAINGKNHYFYGHFPVRKLLIYQAGYIPIAGLLDFWWLTAWTLRHGSSSFFTLQLWKGRSAPWRRVNPRLELPSLVPYRVNVYKKRLLERSVPIL